MAGVHFRSLRREADAAGVSQAIALPAYVLKVLHIIFVSHSLMLNKCTTDLSRIVAVGDPASDYALVGRILYAILLQSIGVVLNPSREVIQSRHVFETAQARVSFEGERKLDRYPKAQSLKTLGGDER